MKHDGSCYIDEEAVCHHLRGRKRDVISIYLLVVNQIREMNICAIALSNKFQFSHFFANCFQRTSM